VYHLIKKNPRLEGRLRLKIARDIAAGMVYLHSSTPPIVHRDLKSPNILLNADNKSLVADFGLSRVYSSRSMTVQVGTPFWMAPEVLLAQKYDTKVDVFSYGVILWELVAGRSPHTSMDAMSFVTKLMRDPDFRETIPEDTPEIWKGLIERCWATNPDARPSFREIMEFLDTNAANMVY